MAINLSPTFIAVFVMILGLLLNHVTSIQFELMPHDTKCISEEMGKNAMSVGRFTVVNPNEDQPLAESQKIVASLKTKGGTMYHHSNLARTGQFSFEAMEDGEYIACFWLPDGKLGPVTVDFDWRIGVDVKELSRVATKGSVEDMAIQLRKLYIIIGYISGEMTYLREREDEMQELNRKTNSQMGWLSLLSVSILLSVVGLQVWHLKTFFEKRKLI